MGARALFKDKLFGTHHFSRWRNTPTAGLAERLYGAFESADRRPGCHYRLIERCAELSGFTGMFVMDTRSMSEIENVLSA